MAKEGYNKVIEWVDNYNNVLISSGPYYMEKYDPKALTIVLKLANNKRVGFATDEINGVKIPFEPHWEEVDIFGSSNAQTAILAVAKGEYDFYWYETGYKDLAKVVQDYGEYIDLVKTVAVWWSVNLNLVGDPETGIVNATGTDQFNPFALRGVRYAMNWLLNRNYIVSNILQGGGAPMFGPEVSGQVDAASRINIVAKALGFTPQGDEDYALKMIDDAMKAAAEKIKEKYPPETPTTTTSTTTTTTSTSTTTSTTSTTTGGGGGICGPALIVALVAIPLLMRRRK
jgi:peptide/nickel transport system substrate-binding protein